MFKYIYIYIWSPLSSLIFHYLMHRQESLPVTNWIRRTWTRHPPPPPLEEDPIPLINEAVFVSKEKEEERRKKKEPRSCFNLIDTPKDTRTGRPPIWLQQLDNIIPYYVPDNNAITACPSSSSQPPHLCQCKTSGPLEWPPNIVSWLTTSNGVVDQAK